MALQAPTMAGPILKGQPLILDSEAHCLLTDMAQELRQDARSPEELSTIPQPSSSRAASWANISLQIFAVVGFVCSIRRITLRVALPPESINPSI